VAMRVCVCAFMRVVYICVWVMSTYMWCIRMCVVVCDDMCVNLGLRV